MEQPGSPSPPKLTPAISPVPVPVSKAKRVSIWKDYGSVCLLCLKTKTHNSVRCDQEHHVYSRLACVKFVNMISKYLQLECDLTKNSMSSFEKMKEVIQTFPAVPKVNDSSMQEYLRNETKPTLETEKLSPSPGLESSVTNEEWSKFVLCESCLPMAEGFCHDLQEYEDLRLQLKRWIFQTTMVIEKSSNVLERDAYARIPNRRMGPLSKLYPVRKRPLIESDVLTNFRTLLKYRGQRFLKRSLPRVRLKRLPANEGTLKTKFRRISGDDTPPTLINESLVNSNEGPRHQQETLSTPKKLNENGLVAQPIHVNSITSLNQQQQVSLSAHSIISGTDAKIPEEVRAAVMSLLKTNPSLAEKNPVISFMKAPNGISTVTGPQINTDATRLPPPPPPVQKRQILLNPPVGTSSQTPILPKLKSQMSFPPSIGVLQCNINDCGKTFSKTEQGIWCMHSHLKDVHSNMPCLRCPVITRSPVDLIKHELRHHPSDDTVHKVGFPCTRCRNWSCYFTDHQRHFFEKHLNSIVDFLECPYCKKGFSHSKHAMHNKHKHIENAHKPPVNESEQSWCDFCTIIFKGPKALFNHLKNDHNIKCHDGPYKCTNKNCTMAFFAYDYLKLHVRICEFSGNYSGETSDQLPAGPGVCPAENCNFQMQGPLKIWRDHIEKNHPDFSPPKCPVCQETFYWSTSLMHHMKRHDELHITSGCSSVQEQSSPGSPTNLHDLNEPDSDCVPVIVSVTSAHTNTQNSPATEFQINSHISLKPPSVDIFLDETDENEDEELIDEGLLQQFLEDESPPVEDPFGWMTENDE